VNDAGALVETRVRGMLRETGDFRMNVRLETKDLDPEDLRDFEELVSESGKDPGDLLRELIHEALAERKRNGQALPTDEDETFFDALSREGLIGCVEGLPADLSTNPRHMEGFGHRG
jgi:hypothetical protein